MVIVDTSVVFKWLVDEEPLSLTKSARNVMIKFLKGEVKATAPDILLYELGNIFSHKTTLTSEEVKNSWNAFQKINLPIFSPNISFIDRSIDFSLKHRVSVYDASYAVLADQKGYDLITADQKFVSKVNLPYVKALKDYN